VIFTRAGRYLRLAAQRLKRMDPARAYDIWSASYDSQAENPLLSLDDRLVDDLLRSVGIGGKVVVDVGCGTGRLWDRLLARQPARLIGYDVSEGMLARLRAKYPQATAEKLDGYRLPHAPDPGCDVLLSTLTLGYLPDLDAALTEWSRALKPGGDMVVTDLHPEMAARGARSFQHEGRTMSIRHHVHAIASLEACAARHGLETIEFQERMVDESVEPIYERASAIDLYRRTRGTPLMYGIHFRKRS
jgi:ubiquinone/menaquinone biosynthesis C-methylase UbiE